MSPYSPCPFCGSGDRVRMNKFDSYWGVVCYGCGVDGPQAKTEEEATALWNQRPLEVNHV